MRRTARDWSGRNKSYITCVTYDVMSFGRGYEIENSPGNSCQGSVHIWESAAENKN